MELSILYVDSQGRLCYHSEWFDTCNIVSMINDSSDSEGVRLLSIIVKR